MPPIPTVDIPSLLAGTSRRLSDIRDFQISRLKNCRGPIDLHRELSDECKNDLEGVWGNIQMCKELAELQRLSQRSVTLGHCQSLEAEYHELKKAYREALIESKRAITTFTRRHDLLTSTSTSNSNGESSKSGESRNLKASAQVGLKDEDALQTKTNEVTDALRRTTQMMQTELERSVLSVQMLEESTRTLRTTTSVYDTYTGLLQTSSNLVKALEKADFWDRVMIGAAFFFFLICVFWIIKRRVLDKVVGGVGWWVFSSFRLIGMGLGIGRTGKTPSVTHVDREGRSKVQIANVGRFDAIPKESKPSLAKEQNLADMVVPKSEDIGSEISSANEKVVEEMYDDPTSSESIKMKDEL